MAVRAGDRVSVIIPTYNRSGLVVRAIASALAATELGDEILVIDDGSTDDTAVRLAEFGEQIRIIRTANAGAGAARNRGVAEARCPLIAFLDSDDEWCADKLYLQRTVMTQRSELVGCFSDFRVRNEDGSEHPNFMRQWCDYGQPWDAVLGPPVSFSSMARLPSGRPDFPVYVGNLYPWLLEGNPISTPSVMTRTSAARATMRFAEGVPTLEDLWFIFSMARSGPIGFLACETFCNHGHTAPRLTNSAGPLTCLELRLRLLEEFWGSDPTFVARRGSRYHTVKSSLNIERATLLIHQGRMAEARGALRAAAPMASLPHRVLAGLPSGAARQALSVRRWVRGGIRQVVRQFTTWHSRLRWAR